MNICKNYSEAISFASMNNRKYASCKNIKNSQILINFIHDLILLKGKNIFNYQYLAASFDTIICTRILKWIILTYGEAGIKPLF